MCVAGCVDVCVWMPDRVCVSAGVLEDVASSVLPGCVAVAGHVTVGSGASPPLCPFVCLRVCVCELPLPRSCPQACQAPVPWGAAWTTRKRCLAPRCLAC